MAENPKPDLVREHDVFPKHVVLTFFVLKILELDANNTLAFYLSHINVGGSGAVNAQVGPVTIVVLKIA
jgi:hypothetical protein